MRTVRDAIRMKGDAPELDALPAHELARGIIQHLVRIDVAVVVGRRDRLGIEVEWPRTEGTDHEPVSFEGLMHRGRLMNPSDDRLEVVDVERPGIEVAV